MSAENLVTGPEPQAHRIIMLKWNRFCGEMMQHFILSMWPQAKVDLYNKGFDALTAIQASRPDLFITGSYASDMDGFEHLEPFVERKLPTLVITSQSDTQMFNLLRSIRYDGLFDTVNDSLDNLVEAIRLVLAHRSYVSPTLLPFLTPTQSITVDVLTAKESMVLAVIGAGCDDNVASVQLDLAVRTVNTHRKAIMAKLRLHHRGDLMLYAVRHGFVHVSPSGVYRPGYERRIREIARTKNGRAAGNPPRCG